MSILKRILLNTALFLLLALGLNALAYHFLMKPVLYEHYFIPTEKFKGYRNFLLGDSHAEAILQKDMEDIAALNFAASSESYFDVYIKLNHLLRNRQVDTVYLALDNHTLSYYREHATNKHRSVRYASYPVYHKYYGEGFLSYLKKKYISIYFPLFETQHSGFMGKRLKTLFSGEKPADYSEFDFSSLSPEVRAARSSHRIGVQFPHGIKSPKLSSCLEDIIETCEKKSIELIGIKFPLSLEFYTDSARISYGADSIFMVHNLKIMDFEDALIDQPSLFRDQDHLNNRGSGEFIRIWKKALYTKRE